MTPFIIFLAISGGIFWAALGAVTIALVLFWAIDVIEERRYQRAILRYRDSAATPPAGR